MNTNLYDLKDPYEIARYIKEAEKQTTAKAYISGDLSSIEFKHVKKFGAGSFWILIGDAEEIKKAIDENQAQIREYEIENGMRNSAIPMLDLTDVNARIEPGAIIRNGVKIEKSAVVWTSRRATRHSASEKRPRMRGSASASMRRKLSLSIAPPSRSQTMESKGFISSPAPFWRVPRSGTDA